MKIMAQTLITFIVANIFFLLGCAYMGAKITSGDAFMMSDDKVYHCEVKP